MVVPVMKIEGDGERATTLPPTPPPPPPPHPPPRHLLCRYRSSLLCPDLGSCPYHSPPPPRVLSLNWRELKLAKLKLGRRKEKAGWIFQEEIGGIGLALERGLEQERARARRRARAREMAAAANMKVKVMLKLMGPLPGRISELLLEAAAVRSASAGQGIAATDRSRRGLAFLKMELSIIVASLRQLASTGLRPDDMHDSHRIDDRLDRLEELASWIRDLLDDHVPVERHGVLELPDLNLAWIEQLLLVDDGLVAVRCHTSAAHGGGDTPHHAAGGGLVGADGPRKKLEAYLVGGAGDDEQLRLLNVLSIVGPAGVGKTALAMEVFRQVRGQFQCSVVVNVSGSRSTPNTKDLLEHIMSQIVEAPSTELPQTTAASEADDEYEMIYHINKFLKDRRYQPIGMLILQLISIGTTPILLLLLIPILVHSAMFTGMAGTSF